MLKILHGADLHLSEAEGAYGLAVFREMVETGVREEVDFLVFCGDLFNAFPDAEALRFQFREIIAGIPFEFIYLPGNHEELQKGAKDLTRLDLGPVTLLREKPFEILHRVKDGFTIEFMGIPHQEQYHDYRLWNVPAKTGSFRMALAHGVVAGMAYRGPDDEGGGAALDPDLFHRFQADYVALGHIHGRREQNMGGLVFSYPGSARIWRRNESGARGVSLLTVAGGPQPALTSRFIPLSSAGEYRSYPVSVSLEGRIPDLEILSRNWGPADWIDLFFQGLVEDEKSLVHLEEELRTRFAASVRCFEIHKDGIAVLPGIAAHPIAKKFLEIWETRDHGDEAQSKKWFKARELALNALKEFLEKAA